MSNTPSKWMFYACQHYSSCDTAVCNQEPMMNSWECWYMISKVDPHSSSLLCYPHVPQDYHCGWLKEDTVGRLAHHMFSWQNTYLWETMSDLLFWVRLALASTPCGWTEALTIWELPPISPRRVKLEIWALSRLRGLVRGADTEWRSFVIRPSELLRSCTDDRCVFIFLLDNKSRKVSELQFTKEKITPLFA